MKMMSANDGEMVSRRPDEVVSEDAIKAMIMPVRGWQVMLDRDLAVLYGVEVKHLNRQVRRNIERFPPDFMFQLTKEDCLRCQIGTLNGKRGEHLKYMPYAFTENGGVEVVVATAQKMIDAHLTPVAVAKFNKQNPTLTVKSVGAFHDRFLILDDKDLYHFGASLNNLGRHYCAVTKMDAMFIPSIMERI